MSHYPQIFGERTVTSLEPLMSDPQSALAASSAKSRQARTNYNYDILSASLYPNAPDSVFRANAERKRKPSLTYYGGITLDESDHQSHGSSNEGTLDEAPRPRKRSKRAPKSDDQDKKQRGRPRLDTKDETAADRRRTQIRLAQRAYRNRKETTISALKQRVGKLESTIESMKRVFSHFQDTVVGSGVVEGGSMLAQQLKLSANEFAGLARVLPQDSDEEEEAASLAALEQSTEEQEPDLALARHSEAEESAPVSTWGYEAIFDDKVVEDVTMPDLPLFANEEESIANIPSNFFSADEPWSTNLDLLQFNAHHDSSLQLAPSVIERPLKSTGPYTYSFQETTFARRLHRLCLEKAFRHLSNPHTDPEYLARTFRFTYCFTNRKAMVVRFQELLKRKAGEALEYWNIPFFRVGGAGTHFPRRDDNGRAIYPPNIVSPMVMFGPQALKTVETPRNGASGEKLLEELGFGGEWFDSNDVEQYLLTKGIRLDGHSTFVEVDTSAIDLPALMPSYSSSSSSSGHSPHELEQAPGPPSAQTVDSEGFLAQEFQDMFGPDGYLSLPKDQEAADQSLNGWDGGLIALPPAPGFPPTFGDFVRGKSELVTMNVSKFLERLLEGGACLGRAPGFRRSYVDHALALSLQEAF